MKSETLHNQLQPPFYLLRYLFLLFKYIVDVEEGDLYYCYKSSPIL